MSYSGDRSFTREYAQIQGINLLMNVIKRLKSLETKLMTIVNDWQRTRTLGLESQVQLIFGTSGEDLTSKYLVHRISMLNDHLLSEFPHRDYALKLTKKCLNAVFRAIQSNSHLWSKVQMQSILMSLGSGYAIKSKGLPFIDRINKKDKKEKKEQITPLSPDLVC